MNKEITFEKIAGYEEEKTKLISIANAFKNIDKLKEMGGKLPRGIALFGTNGIGKTKLAKAFINLSNINYVEIQTNEDVKDDSLKEYLHTQFEKAVKLKPCIIYMDEIDKLIGNSSEMFSDSNNIKSRILLNEINRYNDEEGLFFLLVGNLDIHINPSFIRSGRIDFVIELSKPTHKERKEIIKYYLSKIKYDKNINIDDLASKFKNATGADIESIINNAVLIAFNSQKEQVSTKDIYNAYLNLTQKSEYKFKLKDEEDLEVISTHEAGHAVAEFVLTKKSPDIVTVKSTSKFLAYTEPTDDNKYNISELKVIQKIKILFAGKVAEELILNSKSLGCGNDLKTARSFITLLIRKYGYSGINYMNTGYPAHFGELKMSDLRYHEIEEKEDDLYKTLFLETETLVKENKELIIKVKEALKKEKILFKEDIEKILN